ncbi:RHS repeat-associated core domain-containing protein [Pseudomonas sp. Irchel s3h17]|uniref:RHS repeat-associated core domain-containing protein n=1 Tax=Pseudomonas sp. Irchel s3h17 TaxID=2009182 RepID=UPI000BA4DA8F|nr:RHS repeat-associated core domain-containing protein [Pseudomonas sp. Irchel s3h17]
MSFSQSTLLCHYRYDPLDRLINHTQPQTPSLQRFYRKSLLATEIQGAMQYSIVQHGNQLLAQQQRVADEVGTTTLLAADQQRSVLHTLEVNNQKRSIAYSPYGHRHAESGLLSLLGFNGERPDPVTGHYLLGNGYRAFNPVLMRFNSPDSWSPFGDGGLNGYAYCLGNPVLRTDPTGHALLLPLPRFSQSISVGNVKHNLVGFHVGQKQSIKSLESGQRYASPFMHKDGAPLGEGLYYASESAAGAFYNRAVKSASSGGGNPTIFGVYKNSEKNVQTVEYGYDNYHHAKKYQDGVAQLENTGRIPSGNFDDFAFGYLQDGRPGGAGGVAVARARPPSPPSPPPAGQASRASHSDGASMAASGLLALRIAGLAVPAVSARAVRDVRNTIRTRRANLFDGD